MGRCSLAGAFRRILKERSMTMDGALFSCRSFQAHPQGAVADNGWGVVLLQEREAHEKERSLLAQALRILKEVLGASEGNPGKND
jgi:hypothetical protein